MLLGEHYQEWLECEDEFFVGSVPAATEDKCISSVMEPLGGSIVCYKPQLNSQRGEVIKEFFEGRLDQ